MRMRGKFNNDIMRNLLVLVFIAAGFTLFAENDRDSLEVVVQTGHNVIMKLEPEIKKVGEAPKLYPEWTLVVPGATHFYNKDIGKGLIFSGLTVGGIAYGLANQDKFVNESSSPYYNFPFLLGMQAMNVDKLDFFRNRLEYISHNLPDFRYDPISYNELLIAPFQPKNIFTPITGIFVAAAVAELFLLGPKPNRYFGQVNQMMVMDRYMQPNQALALYGGVSMAASYGAGVGEEYVFRNAVMPMLDYHYGQKKGLIYSSLAFGAMHFTNVFMTDKPDYRMALLQVAEASLAGFLLGYDVQKRGYDIGPAVAAHVWYDFVLMLGSFLVNPQNNFLGVSVQFRM